MKKKKGEKFGAGLLIVFFSIAVSLISFISEENKLTGFATYENQGYAESAPKLMEFKNVDSLATLSPGIYYIDNDGFAYWFDDELWVEIAKVNFADETQKNKQIYIDNEGRIGYVLESVK